MIANIFKTLIGLFMSLFSIVAGIFIEPIRILVTTIFPDIGEYIAITQDFLFNQVMRYAGFLKEVIINVTGLDRGLFYILITLLLARISIRPITQLYKLIINSYKTIKGNLDK